MVCVVATRIRTSDPDPRAASPEGRNYEGYLLAAPVVGRGMVIFRGPHGRRMVTTAVCRVLASDAFNVLYVETKNSVYRVSLREERQEESVSGSPAPLRALF